MDAGEAAGGTDDVRQPPFMTLLQSLGSSASLRLSRPVSQRRPRQSNDVTTLPLPFCQWHSGQMGQEEHLSPCTRERGRRFMLFLPRLP